MTSMRHRRVGALSLVQTRVERPLRDVDDEVGEDDEQREEHRQAQDDRVVAREHGGDSLSLV